MPLTPNTTILNKYRIIRLIGKGGMTRVWLAEDIHLGLQVAIKEAHAGIGSADAHEIYQRFQREVKISNALASAEVPNIVRTFTVEPYEEGLLLVMEYMPGGDLEHLLRKHPNGLPIEQAVRIAQDVLTALAGVHEHLLGIVHRDIKPSNILFDAQGRARLGDLGLAQVAGWSTGRPQMMGGQHPGTSLYMAPEQASTTDYLTPATDIFALGCALFEMLTGERYRRVEPARVSEFRQDTPTWLDDLVAKAVEENPKDRWQDGGKMAHALDQQVTNGGLPVASEAGGGGEGRETREAEPQTPDGGKGRSWFYALPVLALVLLFAFWLFARAGNEPASTPATTSVAEMSVTQTPTSLPPTHTPIPPTDTPSPTPSSTPRPTDTSTPNPTSSPTDTPTFPPTSTPTPRPRETPTPSPSNTPTSQPTNTATPRPTHTPTLRPTSTSRSTSTATLSPIPTSTPGIGSTIVSPIDGMELVYVPAGEFIMGNPDGEGDDDEHPQHTVYLDAFWIDKTEVTNAMFASFVEATGYDPERGCGLVYQTDRNGWKCITGADWRHPQGPDSDLSGRAHQPVVQVDWHDAQAYCQWAGRRLPTEAEWEKAARGTDGRKYSWGDAFDGSKVNYCDTNCSNDWKDAEGDDGYPRVAPVGSYPSGASPYGALDMAGNVWEWVADWYDEIYYARSPSANPAGPTSGDHRLLRGGSWYNNQSGVRSAYRNYSPPNDRYINVGFRCTLSQ